MKKFNAATNLGSPEDERSEQKVVKGLPIGDEDPIDAVAEGTTEFAVGMPAGYFEQINRIAILVQGVIVNKPVLDKGQRVAEGSVGYTIGFPTELVLAFEENARQIREETLARTAELLATDDLFEKPIAMHSLLIEILACHDTITSNELVVLCPSREFWEGAVWSATNLLVLYVLRNVVRESDTTDPRFLVNLPHTIDRTKFAEEVAGALVRDLKQVLDLPASENSQSRKEAGHFAVDYEPSKSEIEKLKKTPQCQVRGVGWNGSTKAWVASWLPQGTHKRVCATFSTRKFGYHWALKLAICQRIRSELLVYGRRKYPMHHGARDDVEDLENARMREDEMGRAMLPPMSARRRRGRPRKFMRVESGGSAWDGSGLPEGMWEMEIPDDLTGPFTPQSSPVFGAFQPNPVAQ